MIDYDAMNLFFKLKNYFGDTNLVKVKWYGIDTRTISKKKITTNYQSLSAAILTLLQTEELNSREIQNRTNSNTNTVIEVLQDLLEQERIAIKANNKYTIHN